MPMDTYYPGAPKPHDAPERVSAPVAPSSASTPTAPAYRVYPDGTHRDARGLLVKGSPAIPGAGRPKGVAAMAREIQTRIGHSALINYFECTWRGWEWDPDTGEVVCDPETGRPKRLIPPPSDEQRDKAAAWLADRGYGKPVLSVDVNAMVASVAMDPLEDAGALADVDVDSLPAHLLMQLEAVAAYVAGKPLPAPSAHVARTSIDVPAVERSDDPIPEPSDGPTPVPVETPDGPTTDPVETPDGPTPVPAEPRERPCAPRERYVFKSSTNLEGYAYDATTSIVTVRFKSGSVYQYANVTPELLADWRLALSAGKWLDQRLKAKPDLFPCRKVDAREWERP